jgi:hypothetical protein
MGPMEHMGPDKSCRTNIAGRWNELAPLTSAGMGSCSFGRVRREEADRHRARNVRSQRICAVRGCRILSRRDYGIVARQFIAWYSCKNGSRPVGHGMIGSDRRATIGTTNQPWVRIRPCPTGQRRFSAPFGRAIIAVLTPYGAWDRYQYDVPEIRRDLSLTSLGLFQG